jgi:malonyl-CoA/methylmalonyl-CoA synthetase
MRQDSRVKTDSATAVPADPSDWIDTSAQQHPQRPFLRTPAGREITYAALLEQSAQFATALMRCGVQQGDRVAVRVEKSVEAVLLYVACLRLGAVFVPGNVAGTPNEFDHVLRDAQPRLAVVPPAEYAALQPLAARAGVAQVQTLGADGEGTLARHALPGPFVATLDRTRDAQTLAAIVYTSGTTGRPKGAMLTRANLASNAAVLARAWHFAGDDVVLHALPLFHVHGLFVAINTALAASASLLLLPKFDAATVLRQLPRVTIFMGVPTHYTRLLQEAGLNRESAARMRLFVCGSAPLAPATHQEFLRRTGHTILERYGMTETLMNASNPYEGARVPGSVGTPLEGIAVRVTHRKSGAVQPRGPIGTLEVRGPNVFAGYWRDAEKTRSEFTADGWFKTGDLGRIDADGYVWIVGRAKDLIISGGYNVYPKEVEAELDAVSGVAESAVFGVPHPDFGEAVAAAVVLKPGATLTEGGLIEAVRTRLSGYKVPKRVLLVSELPRNPMGKVRKEALRGAYAQLFFPSA